MKRFFIFLITVLISSAVFADGYGKVKWNPISYNDLLALNEIEHWYALEHNEDLYGKDFDSIVLTYNTKKFNTNVNVYVVYKKTNQINKIDYYKAESVIYFLDKDKKQELNKILSQYKLIIKFDSEAKDLKDFSYYEDLKFLCDIISMQCRGLFFNFDVFAKAPENSIKETTSIYKYNEDTAIVIEEDVIKDKIIIIYTYHEPDY